MHGMGFPFFPWMMVVPLFFIAAGALVLLRVFGRPMLSGSKNTNNGMPDDIDAQVFRAAKKQGGRLTISDLVIETGWSAKEAEGALERLTNGNHVRMNVSDVGSIEFEFPDLLDHRERSDF
ncbi:MAG: hypothetical protein EA428_05470 [Spirochaetaceae bacterium]|nr:MAG: hypothetical protein EA428_05470 [Spirochaetaceae bacterium]